MTAVVEALNQLGFQEHGDRVAGHLLDLGYELSVPLSGLVALLREAGMPPTRALAVKSAFRGAAEAAAKVCSCAVHVNNVACLLYVQRLWIYQSL